MSLFTFGSIHMDDFMPLAEQFQHNFSHIPELERLSFCQELFRHLKCKHFIGLEIGHIDNKSFCTLVMRASPFDKNNPIARSFSLVPIPVTNYVVQIDHNSAYRNLADAIDILAVHNIVENLSTPMMFGSEVPYDIIRGVAGTTIARNSIRGSATFALLSNKAMERLNIPHIGATKISLVSPSFDQIVPLPDSNNSFLGIQMFWVPEYLLQGNDMIFGYFPRSSVTRNRSNVDTGVKMIITTFDADNLQYGIGTDEHSPKYYYPIKFE